MKGNKVASNGNACFSPNPFQQFYRSVSLISNISVVLSFHQIFYGHIRFKERCSATLVRGSPA